ncbi:MAG: zf-TFIIB domain-containing protein [Elusimicrobia bacterium]|nr:zf-TFIIB domain-containing protein [Elusimicrobiota bacterium]
MNCPKCPDRKLEAVSVSVKDRSVPGPGATVRTLDMERCSCCGGVWFDADELGTFLDSGAPLPPSATAVPTDSHDAKSGACPKCGTALAHAPAPSNPRVIVDRCPRCAGIWVDGAELDKASGKDVPFNERLKAMFGDLGR